MSCSFAHAFPSPFFCRASALNDFAFAVWQPKKPPVAQFSNNTDLKSSSPAPNDAHDPHLSHTLSPNPETNNLVLECNACGTSKCPIFAAIIDLVTLKKKPCQFHDNINK